MGLTTHHARPAEEEVEVEPPAEEAVEDLFPAPGKTMATALASKSPEPAHRPASCRRRHGSPQSPARANSRKPSAPASRCGKRPAAIPLASMPKRPCRKRALPPPEIVTTKASLRCHLPRPRPPNPPRGGL